MKGLSVAASGETGRTDPQLVDAVRAGSDEAFEELYSRYARRVSAYVLGMVKDRARSEDVTQEVFLSALRRMRATDAPIAFRAWIYEIARNACIDQHRRRSRAQELSIDGAEGLAPSDHSRLVSREAGPEEVAEAKQDLRDLAGALGDLSEGHHRILVMRELDGLSYREIGERLEMTRPAVESTLFRARRRLAAEYEELRSGRRCVRVQALLAEHEEQSLGARDRRRLARHLAHCQPCRRHARLAGTTAVPRRSVAARVGALLPLPGWLHRGHGGPAGAATAPVSVGSNPVRLGALLDQLGGAWGKAAAALATVAVAGAGAGIGLGVTSRHDERSPARVDQSRLAQPSSGGESAASSTLPGGSDRPHGGPVSERSPYPAQGSGPAPGRTPTARTPTARVPRGSPSTSARPSAEPDRGGQHRPTETSTTRTASLPPLPSVARLSPSDLIGSLTAPPAGHAITLPDLPSAAPDLGALKPRLPALPAPATIVHHVARAAPSPNLSLQPPRGPAG